MAKKKQKQAKSGFSLTETQMSVLQHASIILVFFLIVYAFFNPLFNNQQLDWHDIKHYKGMAKESIDFREETGEEALWVSTLFSGMPAYQTSITYPGNWFWDIDKLFYFGLPRPANYIFLAFLGFFFLLRTMRINPWLSGIGAAAFALSSYHFIILIPGHSSKANAIAYMAPVIGGALMAYRGKWLLGGAITAFFFALQVSANHYQITYFLALMLITLGIVFGIHAIREKQIPDFVKASAVLVLAGLLGVLPNAGRLMTTSEYAEETIRGKAELASETKDKDSGLSFEYAMSYSEGKMESFSLMIPNFHGGPSISKITDPQARTKARQLYGRDILPTYWGDQTSTSGPSYVGAIICFLFVLGLILVPGKLKWWLLTISIFGLLLSWGKNLEFFASLAFDILPGYKMFRAPTMYLVILEFTIPFLGILGLQRLLSDDPSIDKEQKLKSLYIAAGVTAGLCAFFGLFGSALFDFIGTAEAQRNQLPPEFVRNYRQSLLQSDAFRSAGFILAVAAALWLYLRGSIAKTGVYAIVAVLVVLDLVAVNNRYFSKDNYVSERRAAAEYAPSKADNFILQDTDPNYRVMNFTSKDGPFNDAITSYHHKSVGGYHAAKLRRYNDIITRHLSPESQMLSQTLQGLQQAYSDSALRVGLGRLSVFNMLNTRYFILNPENAPLQNTAAMGNVWFVSQVKVVNSPDEEIEALRTTNLQTTAIVDQTIFDGAFGTQLEGFSYQADPNARISLTSVSPKHLVYDFESSTEQLAVFSEIYYNSGKGWNAYLDGKKVPHFRANYVLRGLRIPSGTHSIEFKFEPKTYFQGNTIGLIGSILCLLVFLGALGLEYREGITALLNRSKKEEEA